MITAILQQPYGHDSEAIRDALTVAAAGNTALVATLAPGHGIPLPYTCGAVLDHDKVRLEPFYRGCGFVAGRVLSEDEPDSPLTVLIPLRNIVRVVPEAGEVQ